MKEYISREALFKSVEDYASTHPVMNDNELFALFCSIPAADVREVVTCGECKHWFPNGSEWCSCDRDALIRHKDFFCAAGERQTNGSDMRGEAHGT